MMALLTQQQRDRLEAEDAADQQELNRRAEQHEAHDAARAAGFEAGTATANSCSLRELRILAAVERTADESKQLAESFSEAYAEGYFAAIRSAYDEFQRSNAAETVTDY